jgi:hypothetical protein|nr:DUF5681 domain-containing protein [uncultured Steroidobacter sp.]
MPFVKGQSGNPAGRKRGSKNRKTLLIQELERDGSALAAAIKAKALEGDMSAASLWLSRLEPAARTRGETVEFDFNPQSTPAQNIEEVMKAVAAGEMSVETGAQLISGIEKLANVRVAEVTEDKERTLIDAFREFATKAPV